MQATKSVAPMLFLLAACSQPPQPPSDASAVEGAMREFFAHIAAFNYDGIRAAVTPDLEIIEDTLRLDREGFVQFIRQFEGEASLAYELSEFNTEFGGDLAYTSYRLKAIVTMGGQDIPREWLESVVFRWTETGWKIDRLQSTPVHDRRT
jgi:hypothetical protein